jgi:HAD superfamily hydrolase (TIGR01509 family)
MAKLRAVIFDIGRVLVRVDIRGVKSALAQGLPLSPEELWSAIEKDPRWPDWQEGRMSPRDWHLHLCKRFQLSLNFEEFTKVWNSALDPQPIHDNSLFAELSRNYRLGLLSNTDPIHVAKLESTYAFFEFFPKPVRTYSCSVGASKPEPLIYREALRACKVRADEAVYIDDIPAYVEAARRLGLTGIHFQSPAQLCTELGQAGIKVEKSCTT